MRSIALVSLALLAAAALPARAQVPSRTITVNGQAEIKVAPDEVVITVGVETDDLDIGQARAANDRRVKAIAAAAAAQGLRAEDIRSDFRTSELRRHRDEARVLAMRAAREKAELMSGALSAGLGSVTSIQEGHSGWWSPYASWWGNRFAGAMYQNVVQDRRQAASAEDTLVPGQLSVTANVTVTFELETRR